MGTFRIALLIVLVSVGIARADCPDRRASCILHEEGVALFLENKHQAAVEKFAAAIAAEPTARSYLGFAQAVEALGQIALAYEMMAKAQQMSQAEIAAGNPNSDVKARAERIKYKLAELRAKIGFVWLRVPQGVSPQRVLTVQREGEGSLAAPLTQWTAVAPNKQVLIATLDDGTKLTVVAQVAAGTQGQVVIPVAAPPVGNRPPPVVGPPPPGGRMPPPFIEPPRSKPIYKRWWFWTLIIVGTLVIISAASGPDDEVSSGFKPMERPLPPPMQTGGATVFRF